MSDFGDFAQTEEKDEKPKEQEKAGEKKGGGFVKRGWQREEFVPARVRFPREGELIGLVVQRLGGSRMDVKATDGKTRNCRVPGRFKRTLWLRPGDIVMIEPWKDDNEKADVIYKYSSSAINQLRKRGILNSLGSEF